MNLPQSSNSFKGLVHPKLKVLSVITHPPVVPTLQDFRTQIKIFLIKSESWITPP